MDHLEALFCLGNAINRELEAGASAWAKQWALDRQDRLAHGGGHFSEEWPDAPSAAVAVADLVTRVKVWVAANVQAGATVGISELNAMETAITQASIDTLGRPTFLC